MRQLFFKAYLAVISLTVLGFLLVLVVFIPGESDGWQDFIKQTDVESRLLKPQLNAADNEQQMQQIIRAYQPAFDLKPGLFKNSELSVAQQTALRQGAGSILLGQDGSDWRAYYRLPGHEVGLLLIEADEFVWEDFKLSVFFLIVLPFLSIMILLAFGLVFMLRRCAAPLLELEAAASRLGEGDMTARVSLGGKSPLHSVSGAFNQMADKITQLITRQQIMIGAIPHELRTPLNRIRFALDMSRSKQDVAGLRQSIEKVDVYVEDLSVAVQEILELNRLQQPGGQPVREVFTKVELLPLLEKVAMACAESGRQFDVQGMPGLSVWGNVASLYRAFLNLAQNAGHYAQQHITLSAEQHHDQVVIRVDDDGDGVLEAEREQIFMPFHRLDSSRNRSTGGIGLGLALVQCIVEEHNGVIHADSAPLGGLRIEITLPLLD